MQNNYLILVPMIFPIIMALLTLSIKSKFADRAFREKYVGITLLINLILVIMVLMQGGRLALFEITERLPIIFKIDEMTMVFTSLVSVMWLLAGIFSFEYMKHENNNESYYQFYLLSLGILIGLGMAGNYLTFYLCYEAMTLLTLPMVLHTGTREAKVAGLKYLFYSVFGASLALIGLFFMSQYGTSLEFMPGGTLDLTKVMGHETTLLVVVLLVIMGFGAKAGMFPLHGWLPSAHPVAPAPASAVLSGVITKAGVLAIIRVVFYQFGADFIRGTFVQTIWTILTLITVFMGSMLAYRENHFKKRLAYSSVSQVSYVLFGLSTLNPIGFVGALMHMVFHSVVKDGLFMSAGAVIYKTHKTYVDELKGLGKSMPVVMWCFTIFGLTLVGIPPTSGFVSKWFLAMGSLNSGLNILSFVGPCVLLTSAFLTAGYLISVSINAFLPGNDFDYSSVKNTEPNLYMLVPLITLAIFAVVFGIYATPFEAFFTSIANILM